MHRGNSPVMMGVDVFIISLIVGAIVSAVRCLRIRYSSATSCVEVR